MSDARAAASAAPPALPPPLTGSTLIITAIALALGTFMQVLDSSIANVSVPTIAGDMGVSADQGTWVITSFQVANGISVPVTGWLMGRFGVVRTFVWSVVLFTAASFLCGVAWNLPSLIAFRILQGGVSGPMIPGSQALLISIFPPKGRGSALALWSMTTLVAPIMGPVLGGYISDTFSWPWIFLINLPVGIVCAWLCWKNMKTRETATRRLPIDRVGFVLLVIWVGAMQIMLDTGKDADWFSSPMIVVLTAVAVLFFGAWIIWQTTDQHPIVDLSLFRSPNFSIGCLISSIAFGLFFGMNVLQSLLLQTRMGYIATWAGLAVAPSGVVAVLLTPPMARLMNRIDARWAATLSLAAFGLSFWLRSGYNTDADFNALAVPMLAQGVAMSVFFVSMVTLTINGVVPERIPQATSLYSFTRLTAASFATSLVTTLWDRREAVRQTILADGAAPNALGMSEAMHAMGRMGMGGAETMGVIARRFGDQAYMLAALDIFRGSSWLMMLLIPVVWTMKPAYGAGASAAAAD